MRESVAERATRSQPGSSDTDDLSCAIAYLDLQGTLWHSQPLHQAFLNAQQALWRLLLTHYACPLASLGDAQRLASHTAYPNAQGLHYFG